MEIQDYTTRSKLVRDRRARNQESEMVPNSSLLREQNPNTKPTIDNSQSGSDEKKRETHERVLTRSTQTSLTPTEPKEGKAYFTTMNMFSPPRREKARAEVELPKGDCRYILLEPEHQGRRCTCVGFALNRSVPGSSCECDHQACYHITEKEMGVVDTPIAEKGEVASTLVPEPNNQDLGEATTNLLGSFKESAGTL